MVNKVMTEPGPFAAIEDAIAHFREGHMVIIVDDEDRENEGDLAIAAEKVTPAAINFMARFGRGLVCLALTEERCRQLDLPLMVEANTNTSPFGTAFTVSIEARGKITTGISAADRAATILTAIAPGTGPEDLLRPGHVFPLRARKGGVLKRAGQTEASVDLATLAGLQPAAVICEIIKDDGTMARLPDLMEFAQEHGLKIGTIADLIRYRLKNERSVERIYEDTVETEYGTFKLFCYEDHVNKTVHIGLVKGDLNSTLPPLVRVHINDSLRDVVGVRNERLGWPLWATYIGVFALTVLVGVRLMVALARVAIANRRRRAHHRMVVDLVGVDQDGAPLDQQVGDGGLPRTDATRQADGQHQPRLARRGARTTAKRTRVVSSSSSVTNQSSAVIPVSPPASPRATSL